MTSPHLHRSWHSRSRKSGAHYRSRQERPQGIRCTTGCCLHQQFTAMQLSASGSVSVSVSVSTKIKGFDPDTDTDPPPKNLSRHNQNCCFCNRLATGVRGKRKKGWLTCWPTLCTLRPFPAHLGRTRGRPVQIACPSRYPCIIWYSIRRLERTCSPAQGDTVTFTLHVPPGTARSAFLRTNAVRADLRRAEIIAHTEHQRPFLASSWLDIPMRPAGDRSFGRLPLLYPGWFAAKCCFMPEGRAGFEWPEGDNTSLKVASVPRPAATASTRSLSASSPQTCGNPDAPSCTPRPPARRRRLHRDPALRHLPRPDPPARLHHRHARLPHPPAPADPSDAHHLRAWAASAAFAGLDFLAVEPALAEFDRRTTPLDQFRELADSSTPAARAC